MRSDADLSKLVNQSGFPMQIGLIHSVKGLTSQMGCRVLYEEHGWSAENGQSGFADLVIEDGYKTSVLVVECKRVLDSDWVFIVDSSADSIVSRSRIIVSDASTRGNGSRSYRDVHTEPNSYESTFCAVAGQDAKARPMLERVAAETILATEAISQEEFPILKERNFGFRLYAPLIVTTARLVVTKVASDQITLATGEAKNLSHAEVPWIRFRKQFSPTFAVKPKNPDWDFSELATAKEKMVYVVNVNSFREFLKNWKILANSLSQGY